MAKHVRSFYRNTLTNSDPNPDREKHMSKQQIRQTMQQNAELRKIMESSPLHQVIFCFVFNFFFFEKNLCWSIKIVEQRDWYLHSAKYQKCFVYVNFFILQMSIFFIYAFLFLDFKHGSTDNRWYNTAKAFCFFLIFFIICLGNCELHMYHFFFHLSLAM